MVYALSGFHFLTVHTYLFINECSFYPLARFVVVGLAVFLSKDISRHVMDCAPRGKTFYAWRRAI